MNWPYSHGYRFPCDQYASTLPQFHLDIAGLGDEYLLEEMRRLRPRLHVLRYVHRGYSKKCIVHHRLEARDEDNCHDTGSLST